MNRRLLTILCASALMFAPVSFLSAQDIDSPIIDGAVSAPVYKIWTLNECIDYALTNNIQILKSELSIDDADIDLKESKAALFPSLTFSSNQNVSFEKNDSEKGIYSGSYFLDASVTVFNGGRNVKAIKQNKLQVENSKYNFLYTANSIELSIIKAYYQILYARESVKTNEEILSTSLRQLERSKAMFEVGSISKVDYAQMESQYQSDNYQLVAAQTAEQEAILSLKQLLELDTNYVFDVADISNDDTLAPVPDKNEVIQIALSTLPEMKAANTEIQIAKLTKEMATGEYFPTVALKASVGTGHSTISSYNWGRQMSNGLNENIGVSISLPIYSNRQIKSKKERADVSILNSQLNLQATIRDISNTIASLHLDAISAQSRYEAAKANVVSSQESYDLVEEKFNVGMQSLVDLLVEKNNLLNALQEKLQSKYTALLDLRLLDFYMNEER